MHEGSVVTSSRPTAVRHADRSYDGRTTIGVHTSNELPATRAGVAP